MRRLWKFLLLATCLNTLLNAPEASPVKGASLSSTQQPTGVSQASSSFVRTASTKSTNKAQVNAGPSQASSNTFQTRIDINAGSTKTVQTSAHAGGHDSVSNSEPTFGILPLDEETPVSQNALHQSEVHENSYNIDTSSQTFSSSSHEESSACDSRTQDCSYTIQTRSQTGGTYASQGQHQEPVQVKNTIATQNARITLTHQQDTSTSSRTHAGNANQDSGAQDDIFQVDSPSDLPTRVSSSRSAGNIGGAVRTNDIQSFDDGLYVHQRSGNPVEWLREGIPGDPGVDYPILYQIPATSFDCEQQEFPAGIYGDMDTECQAFHICQRNGRQDSFLCPNGTVFNQQYFVCDWWYNYKCADTPEFYSLNSEIYQHVDESSFSRIINGVVSDRLINADRMIFVNQNYRDGSINTFTDKIQENTQTVAAHSGNEAPVSSSSPTDSTRLRDTQYNVRSDTTLDKLPFLTRETPSSTTRDRSSSSSTRDNSAISLPVQRDAHSDSYGGYLDVTQSGRPLISKQNIITNQQPEVDQQLFSNDQQTLIENTGYEDSSSQAIGGSNVAFSSDEVSQQPFVDTDFDRGSQQQEVVNDFNHDSQQQEVINNFDRGNQQQEVINNFDRGNQQQEVINNFDRGNQQQEVINNFDRGGQQQEVSNDYNRGSQQQEVINGFGSSQYDDRAYQRNRPVVNNEDHSQQTIDENAPVDQVQDVTSQQNIDDESKFFNTNSGTSFASGGSINQKDTQYTQQVDTNRPLISNRQDNEQRVKGNRIFSSAISRQDYAQDTVDDQVLSHQHQKATPQPVIQQPSRVNDAGVQQVQRSRGSEAGLASQSRRAFGQRGQNRDHASVQSIGGNDYAQQVIDTQVPLTQGREITRQSQISDGQRSSNGFTRTAVTSKPEVQSNLGSNQQGQSNFKPNQQRQSNLGSNQQGQSNFRPNQQRQSDLGSNQKGQSNFRTNQQRQSNLGPNQQGQSNFRPNQQRQSNLGSNQKGQSNLRPNQQRQSNLGSNYRGQSSIDRNISPKQSTASATSTSTGFNSHSNIKTRSRAQVSSHVNRRFDQRNVDVSSKNQDVAYENPDTLDETYYRQDVEGYRNVQATVSSFNDQQSFPEVRTESVGQKEPEVTQQDVVDDFTVIGNQNSFAQQEKVEEFEASTFGPFPALDQLNEDQVDDRTTGGTNTQFSATDIGTGSEGITDTEQTTYDTSDFPTDISNADDATSPQEQTEQQPTEFGFSSGTQDGIYGTVQNNQPTTEDEQKTIDSVEDKSDCEDLDTDSPNTVTESTEGSFSDQPLFGNQPNTPQVDGRNFNSPADLPIQNIEFNQGGFKPIFDARIKTASRPQDTKQADHAPSYNRDQNNQVSSQPNYQNDQNNQVPLQPNYQNNQNNQVPLQPNYQNDQNNQVPLQPNYQNDQNNQVPLQPNYQNDQNNQVPLEQNYQNDRNNQESLQQNYQNDQNNQFQYQQNGKQRFQQNYNDLPNRNIIPASRGIMGVIIRKAQDGGQGGYGGPIGPGATMLLIQPQMIDYPRNDDFSPYRRKEVMPLRRENGNIAPNFVTMWQPNQGFIRDNAYQVMFNNHQQNIDYQNQRNYGVSLPIGERRYIRQEYPNMEKPYRQENEEFGRNDNYQQEYNNNEQRYNNQQQIRDRGYEDNYQNPGPNEQDEYIRPEPPRPEPPRPEPPRPEPPRPEPPRPEPPRPEPPRPEPPRPEEPSTDYDDHPDIDPRFFNPVLSSNLQPQRNLGIKSPIPANIGSQDVQSFEDNSDVSFSQSNENQNINFNNQIGNEENNNTPIPTQFDSDEERPVGVKGGYFNGQHPLQRDSPNPNSQEDYSQEDSTSVIPQLSSWVGSDTWKPVSSNSQGTYRKQSNGQYVKV